MKGAILKEKSQTKKKGMLSYFGKYSIFAIVGPIFILLDVICEVMVPQIMNKMLTLSQSANESNIPLLGDQMKAMITVVILALIFGSANIIVSTFAAHGFAKNLRNGVFDKIQSFSFSNLDRFGTASLITRTTSDVNIIQLAVMFSLRLLIRGPFMLIASVFMAVRTSADLAIILTILIPFMIVVIGIAVVRAHKNYLASQEKLDQLNTIVEEDVQGIRVVKSYVREPYEKEKFQDANIGVANSMFKAGRVMVVMLPILIAAVYLAEGAVLWIGGNSIMDGVMKYGDLLSFITYLTQIMTSIMLIAMAMNFVARAKASYSRVKEIIDVEVDIQSPATADSMTPMVTKGNIEYKDVTFSYKYQSEDDIHDVRNANFIAKPGKVLAIIGSTGSGKSTLVNFIPRFYDVSGGEVLIDGQDVRSFDLDELRESIGMVLQNNILFSGTIRDNIRWGKEDATDEEIIEACKDAQAHDFIMKFPKQYDTWIEQGGVNVSGGQRQRLCIARAMVKKPKILILDDSTSAVDTITEGYIRQAFQENLKDTTVIIVAQRIISVKHADWILVMDKGEIIAQGKHEDLMQTCGMYREIDISQQEGGVLE